MAKQPPEEHFAAYGDTPEPVLYTCWSCLGLFPVGNLVDLGAGHVLPACTGCWSKLSAADRFRVAKELAAKPSDAVQEPLAELIKFMLSNAKNMESGDDDSGDQFSWLTGRRN